VPQPPHPVQSPPPVRPAIAAPNPTHKHLAPPYPSGELAGPGASFPAPSAQPGPPRTTQACVPWKYPVFDSSSAATRPLNSALAPPPMWGNRMQDREPPPAPPHQAADIREKLTRRCPRGARPFPQPTSPPHSLHRQGVHRSCPPGLPGKFFPRPPFVPEKKSWRFTQQPGQRIARLGPQISKAR